MKKTILMIAAAVVIAGVSGGGTYYLVSKQSADEVNNLKSEIIDLTKSVTQLQNTNKETTGNATTGETANWKTYTDSQFGFSFKYPSDVLINPTNSQSLYLNVETSFLSEIELAPLGYNEETARTDYKALQKNDPTTAIGMPVLNSNKMLNIEGGLGKESTILQVIQTCDVEFNRTAFIYKKSNNPFRVIISVINGNTDVLKQANNKYFVNDNSCGGLIWSDTDGFYKDLVAGKTDPLSQEWYKTFDQIISTFQFTK